MRIVQVLADASRAPAVLLQQPDWEAQRREEQAAALREQQEQEERLLLGNAQKEEEEEEEGAWREQLETVHMLISQKQGAHKLRRYATAFGTTRCIYTCRVSRGCLLWPGCGGLSCATTATALGSSVSKDSKMAAATRR